MTPLGHACARPQTLHDPARRLEPALAGALEDAVARAAAICAAPIAVATLATPEGPWVAAAVGVEGDELPGDARFGFHARVDLLAHDGSALGTLSVLDRRAHELTADQQADLDRVADHVAARLELHRALGERDRTAQALRGTEAVHDAIVANALDCIVTIDAHGRVIEFNPSAERTFGWAADEAVGRDMSELIVPPDLREAHRRGMRRLLTSGEARILGRRIEVEAVRKDGSRLPVELTITRIAADPPLFAGHLRDLTERRRAERDLRRLAAIVDSTGDAVIAVGPDARITHWNEAAELLYGYRGEEMVGRAVGDIFPSDTYAADRGRVEHALRGGRADAVETKRVTRDGRVIEVAVTLSPITDADGHIVGASSITRDIGERKRLERELRHQAEFDALTGLANRRRFEAELAERSARADGDSLVFVDLDNFKLVNDSFGHQRGDELIRDVARTLAARAREGDLVARLGGDEFAVILSGCAGPEALAAAEGLVSAIGRDSAQGNLGGSAGVAAIAAGATPEDVMVAADMALYQAKSGGGGRAVAYRGRTDGTLSMVGRVKDAIKAGRLTLHAQPIVDLRTGAVVQHELLVRMLDDDGAPVAPVEFIPVAERFGLIWDIDRWVIARAFGLVAAGHDVAVNLSARSLGEPAVISLVRAGLPTGPGRGRLSFEITETAALGDVAAARRFSQSLARLGCDLALDDFGTGFGSLLHLKHLPVNVLKIDMEFVRALTQSATDRLIVKALVGIARELGHTTIAEGVEDAATLELLRELGVDQAQGYHVGRPAPVAEALPATR